MNRTLIRKWLEIASDSWPPDHNTVLGLEPGEGDLACIEQRVRERMERARCYQLSHPEEATEAMNRLAQALVCLTDPAAKRDYDSSLAGPARARAQTASVSLALEAHSEKMGQGSGSPSSVATVLDLD